MLTRQHVEINLDNHCVRTQSTLCPSSGEAHLPESTKTMDFPLFSFV